MKTSQNGFSLIELLIVIVIIGIISMLAVPSLLRAKHTAENESAYNSLKVIVSTQLTFFASNGRYGRLSELNTLSQESIGTVSGTALTRSKFNFVMSPANPTDAQLKSGYHITVTKEGGGEVPYTLDVDESGTIIEPYNSLHR